MSELVASMTEHVKVSSCNPTGVPGRRSIRDEPSVPDQDSGNTALHDAVRHGQTTLAASLLAEGTDWTISNAAGELALSPEFATLPVLHRIRQEYHRLRAPASDGGRQALGRLEPSLTELERDGVARVRGCFNVDEVKRMQTEFRAFVRKVNLTRWLPGKRFKFKRYDQREYWQPKHQSYVTNDAFRYSPELVSLCCKPEIIALANRYLRKPAHVKRAYGMRYLPRGEIRKQQFLWHHDMEDRQLKIMILLTEVGEQDQYMTYVRGSHEAFHPVERFETNALDFDYCRTYLDDIDVVKLTGEPGDMFLFDSNGMHRGNRSNGRIRDAFFVEFTADRNQGNVWGTSAGKRSLPRECAEPGHPLSPMLSVQPKWERVRNQPVRKTSTWLASLEDPSQWV